MAVLSFLEEVVPAQAEQVGVVVILMNEDVDGDGDGNCQVMVEQGLASVLERRCGGGEHCCR